MDGEGRAGPELVVLGGGRTVEAVGESRYQRALERLAGGRREQSASIETTAVLVPEPANPPDPPAVRVEIGGELVGYLGRVDAPRYRPLLDELARQGRAAACRAFIVVGRRRDGSEGGFGVALDLAPPDRALPPATQADSVLPAASGGHAGAVSASGRAHRPRWRRKRVLLPVVAVAGLAAVRMLGSDRGVEEQLSTAVATTGVAGAAAESSTTSAPGVATTAVTTSTTVPTTTIVAAPTAAPATNPTPPPSRPFATVAAQRGCDLDYAGACVPPYPPDVDCPSLPSDFARVGGDPHRLDADNDGVACESGSRTAPSTGVARATTSAPVVASAPAGTPATERPPPTTASAGTSYANCAAARAAGAAPLTRGEPGYRSGLDRDGDGIACESPGGRRLPTPETRDGRVRRRCWRSGARHGAGGGGPTAQGAETAVTSLVTGRRRRSGGASRARA